MDCLVKMNGNRIVGLNRVLTENSDEPEFKYQNRLVENAIRQLAEYEKSGLIPYQVEKLTEMLRGFNESTKV